MPASSTATSTLTTETPSQATDLSILAKDFLAAQLAGDRQAALRVLVENGLQRGFTIPELHLKVIQPAQYEIGRLWQENRISVAREHLATAIAQLGLAHLYRHRPRDESNGRKVLVSWGEGELHEVGARMASDFLEMAGFDVYFLGANVPTDHLVTMVCEEKPDLVVLSVAITYHLPALKQAVARLRAEHPRLPIAVGGGALAWVPELERELEVAYCGKDARELVAAACRLLGV